MRDSFNNYNPKRTHTPWASENVAWSSSDGIQWIPRRVICLPEEIERCLNKHPLMEGETKINRLASKRVGKSSCYSVDLDRIADEVSSKSYNKKIIGKMTNEFAENILPPFSEIIGLEEKTSLDDHLNVRLKTALHSCTWRYPSRQY